MRELAPLMIMLVAVGCSGGQAPVVDATYTVRGVVLQLPAPNQSLRIHHEAIADFAGPDGTVDGMMSMAMGFDLAEGVSVDRIAVGQKVQFDFDVWRKPVPGFHITQITILPDDTKLDLGRGAGPEH